MNIELISEKYREDVLKMGKEFYASDAVDHNIPEEYLTNTINSAMNENICLDGYVFVQNGKAVGFSYISEYFETEVGGICVMIIDLYIKNEYRRNGFASQYFKYVFDKYSYAKRFRLEVEDNNIPAVNTYKKLGFEYLSYKQMIINK